uniref:Hypothetical protein c54338 mRNA n=1 Tax=Margaritifera margaritifera TaxID=102329 RepID=A0A0C4Y3Z9_PINMG|nr:hypothetical protein c54338 [Pinctada margaritifera]
MPLFVLDTRKLNIRLYIHLKFIKMYLFLSVTFCLLLLCMESNIKRPFYPSLFSFFSFYYFFSILFYYFLVFFI